MRNIFFLTLLLFVCSQFFPSYGLEDSKEKSQQKLKENIATETTSEWLKIIDLGFYEEGWENCAKIFKNAVEKFMFKQSLIGVRKPLGKVLKRKEISKKYTTTIPVAPDGEFVIIQFKTEFENKKEIDEIITVMIEKDGRWRVAGYFIK
jgi:hypothetical protein